MTNRSIRAPENKLNNMSQLELILRNGRVAQSATKLDLYSHHITQENKTIVKTKHGEKRFTK